MLVEVMEKSQITLPDEIVSFLGIAQGDKLEAVWRGDGVFLRPTNEDFEDYKNGDTFEVVEIGEHKYVFPVVEISDEKWAKIDKMVEEHEADPGPDVSYSCVDEMFKAMGIDLGDDDEI